MAVKKWLIEQEPGLADEIFLDLDPHTGIRTGERWKEALNLGRALRGSDLPAVQALAALA